jgi:hypothetical protein
MPQTTKRKEPAAPTVVKQAKPITLPNVGKKRNG